MINNQLGPNMPLLRARAVDGYVVASEARGHRFQLDVQLPIETKSYNVDMHDYEASTCRCRPCHSIAPGRPPSELKLSAD